MFGVFDDSMPDGWGRLLTDRMLRQHGIDPYSVGPLARLSIVGHGGMGALEYEPASTIDDDLQSFPDLDSLAEECLNVLSADFSNDLDQLFVLGGSSGGARPKILTTINGEEWIIKFPSSVDAPDIGEMEYHISNLARTCGIDMPETRLFPSRRCAGYFGVNALTAYRSRTAKSARCTWFRRRPVGDFTPHRQSGLRLADAIDHAHDRRHQGMRTIVSTHVFQCVHRQSRRPREELLLPA